MNDPHRESQLVPLVMKDATEEEIVEATRRWFGFLETLHRIVLEQEREKRAASHHVKSRDLSGFDATG